MSFGFSKKSARRDSIEKLLKDTLHSDKNYQEALKVARMNSVGNIWLVGGFVYRTLAAKLYGFKDHLKDFDFIIDEVRKPPIVPNGWKFSWNKHGNPKLNNNRISLDLIPIHNIHSIIYRNLDANIDNYLTGVPLTIQSIAYNIRSEKLVGEVGIQCLLTRTISVCNFDEYEYARNIYGNLFSVAKYTAEFKFKELVVNNRHDMHNTC